MRVATEWAWWKFCGGIVSEVDQSHEIPTASFYFKPEDQAAERNPIVSFLLQSLKPVRDRSPDSPWLNEVRLGNVRGGQIQSEVVGVHEMMAHLPYPEYRDASPASGGEGTVSVQQR